jgi:hypothetical protein
MGMARVYGLMGLIRPRNIFLGLEETKFCDLTSYLFFRLFCFGQAEGYRPGEEIYMDSSRLRQANFANCKALAGKKFLAELPWEISAMEMGSLADS